MYRLVRQRAVPQQSPLQPFFRTLQHANVVLQHIPDDFTAALPVRGVVRISAKQPVQFHLCEREDTSLLEYRCARSFSRTIPFAVKKSLTDQGVMFAT